MAQCYLCDSISATERDHIPPKAFFPSAKGLSLVTVPVCTSCHDQYDNVDERARNYFLLAENVDPKADGLRKGKLLRGLSLNRPQKKQILSSARPTWVSSEAGILTPAIQVHMPADEINAFIIRIAKGLLSNHYGRDLYSQMNFDVTLFQLKNAEAWFSFPFLLKEFVIDPKIFRYRIGIDEESKMPQGALVVIEFYSAVGAAIFAYARQDNKRVDATANGGASR